MSFGATFLRNPDLFPGRRGGEAWGDRRVTLELPGGPYRFAGLSAAQEAAVRDRFGDLCGVGVPPGERLRVRPAACQTLPGRHTDLAEDAVTGLESLVFAAPESDFLPIDTRGWEYALDLDYGPRAVRLAGLGLLARLDWAPELAGALWTSEEGERFAGIFENFVRVLAAYRLVESGGAILHSAAALDAPGGERVFLFLGRSGAGKTTVSRLALASGRPVLSDDLNAVRPGAGPGAPARVEKLPFTGDLGDRGQSGASYPLRGVLRLEKGAGTALSPLTPARSVAALLAAAPFVNNDPYRRERLVESLERVARATPAGVLTFSRAGGFWDMLMREFQ